MKNKISQERKKYLKKVKTKKLLVIATQLVILIGFLAIWEALANAKIIDSFITSQPSRIWNTFMNLTSNDLLKHVKVTVYETIVGFGLGTIMGVLIAIILWWSKFLAKVSEPFLVVLNSLPKVALGPIIIIWVIVRIVLWDRHAAVLPGIDGGSRVPSARREHITRGDDQHQHAENDHRDLQALMGLLLRCGGLRRAPVRVVAAAAGSFAAGRGIAGLIPVGLRFANVVVHVGVPPKERFDDNTRFCAAYEWKTNIL